MALNALGLGIVFTAKDLASGVMSKVSSKFKGLHEEGTRAAQGMGLAFSAFKVGIGVMAGGLATLGGAFALADAYGALDDALDDVQRNTQATGEELEMLEQAAFRAGLATKFKPEEAVKAMGSLAKAYGNVTDAAEQGIHVLNLASATGLEVGEAAKLTTSALKIYGYEAGRTQEVVDKFAKAQQVTQLTAKDLQQSFRRSAAVGAQFGQSLDDTILALGLFKARGLEGRQVMTAYSGTLKALATDKKMQAALDSKGIQTIDKSTGKMRDMTVIIADVVEATKDMSEADKNAFIAKSLGTKGQAAFDSVAKATFRTIRDGHPVVLKGTDAVAAMGKAMDDAKGAAEKLTDALLDDFGGQQELIGSAVSTIQKMVGKEFATALKPVAQVVLSVFRRIGQAILDTPAPIKQFIAKLVLLGGAVATVFGAFMAGSAAFAVLVIGIKLVGATLLSVLGIMAPFLAIFAVGAAVVAGFKYAVDHNIGGIGTVFFRAFNAVKLAFQGMYQLFTQGGFSGAVRDEMRKGENQGIRAFAITVFMWVGRIKNFFRGIATGFQDAMAAAGPSFEAFGAALKRLAEAFGIVQDSPGQAKGKYQAWGATGKQVGELIAKALTTVVDVMTKIINLSIDVGNAINKVAKFFGGWDGIMTGVKYALVALTLYMGVQAVTALVAFGGAALAAAGGLGALSFAGVIAGAASMLGPVGAAVAMFTALYAAIDQAMKLYKEWDENSSTQIGTELKHDLGITSDAEYNAALAKRQGIQENKTYAPGTVAPARPAGFIGPPPPGGFSSPPTPQNAPGTVQPAPPPKGPSSAEVASAASTAAATAAVAAAGRVPPGVISAVMTVDGEVLGKIAARHAKGAAAAAGDVDVGVDT